MWQPASVYVAPFISRCERLAQQVQELAGALSGRGQPLPDQLFGMAAITRRATLVFANEVVVCRDPDQLNAKFCGSLANANTAIFLYSK